MKNEKWKMKSYVSHFCIFHFTLLFWLGCLGSNQGMPESKSGALPLGYSPKTLTNTAKSAHSILQINGPIDKPKNGMISKLERINFIRINTNPIN